MGAAEPPAAGPIGLAGVASGSLDVAVVDRGRPQDQRADGNGPGQAHPVAEGYPPATSLLIAAGPEHDPRPQWPLVLGPHPLTGPPLPQPGARDAVFDEPFDEPYEFTWSDEISGDEAVYAAADLAVSTRRAYRNDWRAYVRWCAKEGLTPLPSAPSTVSRHLVWCAGRGMSVRTIKHRLSALRYVHHVRDLPDPTSTARVARVWTGIQRIHGRPPRRAAPLTPPDLLTVLQVCPTSRRPYRLAAARRSGPDAGSGDTPDTGDTVPDLAGLRTRAMLLIGFWGALRRGELAALTIDDVIDHDRGLVLRLPRSKGNQFGHDAQYVALPWANDPDLCPVRALRAWTDAAGLTAGPLLRPVRPTGHVLDRRLNPEAINWLLQTAVGRAGLAGGPWSAHSLRAGFATWAYLCGASRRAIARQMRHRRLDTVEVYVRTETVWEDNAATMLEL